jgi:thymidylate synthase
VSLHYEVPTVSQALPVIMNDLLEYGAEVGSRNGRVKELLNTQITLTNPVHREVLTLNRKANVFAQIAETMWVIAGRNDIEWLSAYLPRAADYSDDGQTWRAGYGPRIRKWGGWPHQDSKGAVGVDQLAYVVDTLRADPLSRQAVIGIWDPTVDTTPGKDKACNTFLQFQSRGGALYLTVNVRSNDIMWGWSGINAFEWSTLQEIVASLLGINVGDLTFNIGSLHLYEQHWSKASRVEYEQMTYAVTPFDPFHTIKTVGDLDRLLEQWFVWEQMCRNGEATFAVLTDWFAEPLFASWAAAIAYYWQRDDIWLESLSDTALAVAIARTPVTMLPEPRTASSSSAAGVGHNLHLHERVRAFYEFATNLHAVKHASYGDSWKKRGEKMSILANMARKVDRLGVGDEFDSSSDTVVDLLIYAIKYHCWLEGEDDGPANVNQRLGLALAETEEFDTKGEALDITFADVLADFDYYADNVDGLLDHQKVEFVTALALRLAPIARDMWWNEHPTLDGLDEYRGADVD